MYCSEQNLGQAGFREIINTDLGSKASMASGGKGGFERIASTCSSTKTPPFPWLLRIRPSYMETGWSH